MIFIFFVFNQATHTPRSQTNLAELSVKSDWIAQGEEKELKGIGKEEAVGLRDGHQLLWRHTPVVSVEVNLWTRRHIGFLLLHFYLSCTCHFLSKKSKIVYPSYFSSQVCNGERSVIFFLFGMSFKSHFHSFSSCSQFQFFLLSNPCPQLPITSYFFQFLQKALKPHRKLTCRP